MNVFIQKYSSRYIILHFLGLNVYTFVHCIVEHCYAHLALSMALFRTKHYHVANYMVIEIECFKESAYIIRHLFRNYLLVTHVHISYSYCNSSLTLSFLIINFHSYMLKKDVLKRLLYAILNHQNILIDLNVLSLKAM